MPHERLGKGVAAAVVPKPGRAIRADALRAFLGRHLEPFKMAPRISFHTEALPRNPAGKILECSLRDPSGRTEAE